MECVHKSFRSGSDETTPMFMAREEMLACECDIKNRRQRTSKDNQGKSFYANEVFFILLTYISDFCFSEPTIASFNVRLQNILMLFERPEFKVFGEYFMKQYRPRTEQWAMCHRIGEIAIVTMANERTNRFVIYVYAIIMYYDF